jgi:hypothetical protein
MTNSWIVLALFNLIGFVFTWRSLVNLKSKGYPHVIDKIRVSGPPNVSMAVALFFFPFFALMFVFQWWTILYFDMHLATLQTVSLYLVSLIAFGSTNCTLALVGASPLLNSKYGKLWVKFLDIVYLIFGCAALFRLVNSSGLTEKIQSADTAGLLLVALAIVVRASKALVEVFFDDFIKSKSDAGG